MNTTMRDPLACDTHALNALLRGEMAAVETYTLVLGTSDDQEMIADLQKIPDLLSKRGYSSADVEAIMHGNWLRFFAEVLPN